MAKFYSRALGGFLDDAIHAALPDDALAVTDRDHAALLAAQRAGKAIVAREDGRPHAVARPAPSIEERRVSTIAAVKREAAHRIDAVAPIWRQLNDVADLARSSLAGIGAPTDAWRRREAIDAIRAASDRFEAAIATMSARALAALDIRADHHWPS